MPSREDGLDEKQDWLRITLSNLGDALITTDVHGCVTFLNPIAQNLTGWSLGEAIGTRLETVFRIIDEETRQPAENLVSNALRDGMAIGLANHSLLVAKDGTRRAIEDSASVIRSPEGEITGIVLVFRDVTERRKADQSLRQSEERFRLLVEGTRDYAIFMLDPTGHVASWNPGAERIKGYRAEEIIGKHFSCFYPKEVIERGWPEEELRVTAAEGRFEDENWRLRKDGTRFWANVIITALRDESGQLCGFSKITRDLTDRRRAETSVRDSEVRYRRLFETARDCILILNARTEQIIDANPAAFDLLGFSRDELCGKDPAQLGILPNPDSFRTIARLLETKGHLRTDNLSLRTRDGRSVEVELVSALYTVHDQTVIQCNIRDISERRQLERTRSMMEASTDLHRRKDEFLAMLSHELRNPLAAIMNAVHLLRLQQRHENPLQQQARSIIDRQTAQLAHLVDDLLEVSRITTGRIKLHCERLDLRAAAQSAWETVRPLIEQRRHQRILSLPDANVPVIGDPTRIEQIIVNLLNNAAKYTEEGGHIGLSVQKEDNEAVLRVRDNGVGIARDLLPRIFDLFTQSDRSLDRSQGGLGIGRTLVHRLVELHGGTVEVFSTVGQGSEFVVHLPLADVSARPHAAAQKSRQVAG